MVDENRLTQHIADRIKALRAARDFSLDGLAAASGVSRSMISLIERGESSPTAVVLEKLATALAVPLATLFDAPFAAQDAPVGPVSRRQDQAEWRDPGSGYVRRNVSPANIAQPLQIVDVLFPPGARVAFENGGRDARMFQQVWMLEGTMEVAAGSERHRLREGDCMAMQLDQPTMFHNPTRKRARYAVVIATEAGRR